MDIVFKMISIHDFPWLSNLVAIILEGSAPRIFPERPDLIHICTEPMDAWVDIPNQYHSSFQAKQALCRQLMSLGVAICEPKVEGESLVLGQLKCSSLLLQHACGFERLFVGHFGAEMPLHPSITDSIESKLTAVDLAFVDKFADPSATPLVGINIEETSGVSRAWLGGGYPPLKMRVNPILPFCQAKIHMAYTEQHNRHTLVCAAESLSGCTWRWSRDLWPQSGSQSEET